MSSHTSFLAELAVDLYHQHRGDIAKLTFVFPHERVGQAFHRCWATYFPSEVVFPKVYSLEAWIQQWGPLQRAESLLLTHYLHEAFQALQPTTPSFGQFYSWGSVLLEDLDVIERHLIDAPRLFLDLSKHKALESSHDYLNERQREAIQSFWRSFGQRLSIHQRKFLDFWELLPHVYQRFKERLQAQSIGYSGLCQRAAYTSLLQGSVVPSSYPLVFAGFHRLTPVEEKILTRCQAHGPTAFYWDVDAYYMDNTKHEAGLYLRKYRETYFKASFREPLPSRIASGKQMIHVHEVASEVGQVQVLKEQLKALMETQGSRFVPHQTAVVVVNKFLHWPVWYAVSSFPGLQTHTNLGAPLKNTASYRLLELLLTLHLTAVQEQLPTGYFSVHAVLHVLQHPHVMGWNPSLVQSTIARLRRSGTNVVAQQELTQEHTYYNVLFQGMHSQVSLVAHLLEVLKYTEAHAPATILRSRERGALQQLIQQLGRLQDVLPQASDKPEALLQLLRQLLQSAQLPLGNATPDGVHVLDMAATQNLDFKYVFVVGMNEGHFPEQAGMASFLPYSLRKGYGLPTSDQHPSASHAYYFYRLLQRAEQVHLTYHTQANAEGQAEMSRYLLQLSYESGLRLKKQAVTHPIHLPDIHPIVVHKKGVVWAQLMRYLLQEHGTSPQSLTPSSLNTYIDCSLRFYFHHLAQLKVPEPPQRATHALVFGKLLHEVMERLYAPLMTHPQGPWLLPEDFVSLRRTIPHVLQEVFGGAQHGAQKERAQGDDALARAVMAKIVDKLVLLDQAHAPFMLVGLEMGRQVPLYVDFSLNNTARVRLQGIIDRVDWQAGTFRILDYKTGKDGKKLPSIPSLFDREITGRNKAAFQTFFYAWLFYHAGVERVATSFSLPVDGVRVMPALFNTRELFAPDFDPRFVMKQMGRRDYQPIEDLAAHRDAWEEGLRATLTEFMDPTVPFSQTDDVTRCTTCPYKGICQRS